METAQSRPAWNIADLDFRLYTVGLALLVAFACYQADILAFVLGIPPDHIASFWPASAILVAVLQLVSRRIRLVLIIAGLGAMALADIGNGVPVGYEIWITLGNLGEVLVATLGLDHLLKGTPHIGSMRILVKYILFAVILVPVGSALLGATGSVPGTYWVQWRLWFFADALAFLSVAPAIWSWVRDGREWARKLNNYLEFAALMTSLFLVGYLSFLGPREWEQPALLYSLVPLLLWAAWRMGLKGVSTSIVAVALLSSWGAAHGRGPFSTQGPLNSALSLQLFLFFAAIPFTMLAVLVEEQKRVQQALIDEDAQLTEAQRLAQMGSWQWDVRSGTVTWSQELYRIASHDPNIPPPGYKEFSHFYTPESWERLDRAIKEALRAGTPYDLDLEIVRPDSTKRWIRTRGETHRDAGGRVILLRGTAQDITERKLSETEVALANDRLRLAMESGKSVGWDWDFKTGQDSWFGDLQTMFGIPSATYVGYVDDFRRYVHPDDRERVSRAIKESMQSRTQYAAEFRILWQDGTLRWVAARGKFFYSPDSAPERMVGMAVDITERKQLEEALRESEERLRLAAQVGKMYAFDWDVATDVAVRSEEITRIPGLVDEPIRLTAQQFLSRVHPEDRKLLDAAIVKSTPESPDHQISFRLLRPDGSVLWLERTGRAFFDEKGKLVRMIGMAADVTERKRAEEALAKVGGRLIEAHEEERTWIARELHDDLGQRLALLANNLELMERNPSDSIAETRDRTHEQLMRVHEIAADLQAMSHRLHSSKLELLGIVAASRSFCQELAEQQEAEIDFTHTDIPPAVPKEISLCLFRVMQEALQNAVKHSGVRHFEVDLRGTSDGIDLTVHDSGIGFDPAAVVNNRGLGLISMQERANLVKGTLSVNSQPDHGTTIRAHLPLQRKGESARAAGE